MTLGEIRGGARSAPASCLRRHRPHVDGVSGCIFNGTGTRTLMHAGTHVPPVFL